MLSSNQENEHTDTLTCHECRVGSSKQDEELVAGARIPLQHAPIQYRYSTGKVVFLAPWSVDTTWRRVWLRGGSEWSAHQFAAARAQVALFIIVTR